MKCLTRHVKDPRSGHMIEIKRLVRYLTKNKRCVLTYPRQMSDVSLQVHVDSDWAGDMIGRKSTTEVFVIRGKHLLRHMSCLQTLVAFSCGEAAYYALIRSACTSLGIQSHYQDWMIDVPIDIYSNSAGTGNWRTSETLADVSLAAAEPSSTWPFEVWTLLQASQSSRHTHESFPCRFAGGQNMLDRRGCSCHSDEAAATANLRIIVLSRTSEQ